MSGTNEGLNLGCVKCSECGVENSFRLNTVEFIDNIETEKERICNNCNHLMDYWAYGYWESNCI